MKQMPETLVQVGAEGGTLTLSRVQSKTGDWEFFLTTDEGTLHDFMSDEDRSGLGSGLSETGPVATWDAALALLDRYPWSALYPLAVHEDFRAAVWAAVEQRQQAHKNRDEGGGSFDMDRWRRLCVPPEERNRTRVPESASAYVQREIAYPGEWESEYKENGVVAEWLRTCPRLFQPMLDNPKHPGRLSDVRRTLDMFPQYALQYLLLANEGADSITWFKLPVKLLRAKNRQRIDGHWQTMRRVMGTDRFTTLQDAIIEAGFTGIRGEPDLFCWTPNGHWFFAEAKHRDRILDSQEQWGRVCQHALGHQVDLRVYRLRRAQ